MSKSDLSIQMYCYQFKNNMHSFFHHLKYKGLEAACENL